MKKTDDYLWRILAIIGLNFLNSKLGLKEKICRFLLMISFAVSVSFYSMIISSIFLKQRYKLATVSSSLGSYPILMWYIAYSKKKTIQQVVFRVYQQRNYGNASKKSKTCIVVFLVFFTVAIPCVSYISAIEKKSKVFDEALKIIFGLKIKSNTWKSLFMFFLSFAHSLLFYGFPFYLTICIGTLFHRCSEMLSDYKIFLRTQLYASNVSVRNLVEFFYIVNLLRKLNNAFTHLLFFIILYHLQAIFIKVLIACREGLTEKSMGEIVIVLYFGICNIVLFVYLTICSSLIPENLMKIKTFVKNFLNIFSGSGFVSKQNLFYLKRIENEDIVHISVCRMFVVIQKDILSALGIMLTYGLLIINLEFVFNDTMTL